jgi:hypothetical protein
MNVVYLVIVFLTMILPMLLLSSKLKRNLIIAQNLTVVPSIYLNHPTNDKISPCKVRPRKKCQGG